MLKDHNKILVLVSNLKHKQPVILNPSRNNTETTESVIPTEVTGTAIPTNSTLTPGNTIPLQDLTKTISSNSYI